MSRRRLSSDNPSALPVPATVTVRAGATSGTFRVKAGKPAATAAVTVRGEYGGVARTTVVTVLGKRARSRRAL